jgi:hypothetical protein
MKAVAMQRASRPGTQQPPPRDTLERPPPPTGGPGKMSVRTPPPASQAGAERAGVRLCRNDWGARDSRNGGSTAHRIRRAALMQRPRAARGEGGA